MINSADPDQMATSYLGLHGFVKSKENVLVQPNNNQSFLLKLKE